MHIAINAHLLAHTKNFRRAGVSNYTEQLINHLGLVDQTNRYTIFTTRGLRSLGLPANFRVRPSLIPTINPRIRVPWEQFLAPALLRLVGADLYHGVLNVMPLASPVPSVVTIHDLSPFLFPQTFRRVNRVYTRWAIRVACRNAAHLIAVSEFTKQEIIRWMHVPAERITVTHNGVQERFFPRPAAELAAFRKAKQLPDRFILFVGTLEPRKNLPTLLEAYARIAADADLPLIIAGGKGWLYDPIFAKVEALGLSDRVIFPGFLDDDELPLWYQAATVFVLPSLYEGFGIPLLEAMACGTPVVASNRSSLPEVIGDAGVSADPTDPDVLGAALLQVLRDRELQADLRARGLERAKQFTWTNMAKRTLSVYQSVLHPVLHQG
ncbi:MAG: glycosyltransferase family 1 protein [Roseiflexaceae bacterium]